MRGWRCRSAHSSTPDGLWTAGLLGCFISGSHWVGPGVVRMLWRREDVTWFVPGIESQFFAIIQRRTCNTSRLEKVGYRVDRNGVARQT
jgi:hypothetical protein